MSAVLHKGSSGTAREASLALVTPERAVAAPKPDQREAEIARLKAEREDLRKQLATAEQRHAAELAELKVRARQAVAEEFRQDDARRLDLLAKALERSVGAFEAQLIAGARGFASRLARYALERLVRVGDAEARWLSRAIERRLDDLDSQAVVGVQVAAADWSEALIEQVGGRLADRAALFRDASLPAGSARIGLRLGEVTVDVAAGLARLLDTLSEGDRDD